MTHRIVGLSGYPGVSGCAPCAMGAIEIVPPTIEDDDAYEGKKVLPVREVMLTLGIGAAVVTLAVVGLIYVTRKT